MTEPQILPGGVSSRKVRKGSPLSSRRRVSCLPPRPLVNEMNQQYLRERISVESCALILGKLEKVDRECNEGNVDRHHDHKFFLIGREASLFQ